MILLVKHDFALLMFPTTLLTLPFYSSPQGKSCLICHPDAYKQPQLAAPTLSAPVCLRSSVKVCQRA